MALYGSLSRWHWTSSTSLTLSAMDLPILWQWHWASAMKHWRCLLAGLGVIPSLKVCVRTRWIPAWHLQLRNQLQLISRFICPGSWGWWGMWPWRKLSDPQGSCRGRQEDLQGRWQQWQKPHWRWVCEGIWPAILIYKREKNDYFSHCLLSNLFLPQLQ